jgi:hypothetical protein
MMAPPATLRAFVWVIWIRDLPTLETQHSRMSEGDSPPAPTRSSFAAVDWIPHSSNSCSKC